MSDAPSLPRSRVLLLPLLAATLAAAGCWIEEAPVTEETPEEPGELVDEVRRTLSRSAEAWNRGDLDGFMESYLDSPTTTYVGDGGVFEGVDEIRGRYAPRFAPGAERDSLRFENLRGRLLGSNHAVAYARWTLYRGGEVTASGPFSMVVRATEDGWRILHDHSSSDPPEDEEAEETGEDGEAESARPAPEAG